MSEAAAVGVGRSTSPSSGRRAFGWLADLRVSTKILTALTVVAVVAVGVGVLSLSRIGTLKGNIDQLANQSVVNVREHGDLVAAVRLARIDLNLAAPERALLDQLRDALAIDPATAADIESRLTP